MESLETVLVSQLKDLYDAENQHIEALTQFSKEAKDSRLKSAVKTHLRETKEQVKRLKKIGKLMKEDLEGHPCKAMKGLVKEGQDILRKKYENDVLRDVQIVAAIQKVEHYEIAGYGNAVALAEFLNLSDIKELLQATLEEEGATDKLLTEVCMSSLLPGLVSMQEAV